MTTGLIQQTFFNHIKTKLPPHFSFVDEIAELLSISNDSAYRRIRGEKQISLEEAHLLCSKYQVSIDKLFNMPTNAVIFSVDKVDHLSYGFNDYLEFVVNNLKLFKTLPNPHIYFYYKDIPIFHYMPFHELCAFKFFFWKRTLMGYPELSRQQFTGDESDTEALETAKKIIELYNQIPSTDIWNEESINITIKQIEFYRQSKLFTSKDLLLKVYQQLEELLNHLESQAALGRKITYNDPSKAHGELNDVYINEVLIGDNMVFVKSGERQITFINHNGLNFMSTEDKTFCDYTFNSLQNIIRKSTHISVIGEGNRSVFFNTLREKIHEKMKSI